MESTVTLVLDDYEKLKDNAKKTNTVIINIVIDRYRNYPDFISEYGNKFSNRFSKTFSLYGNEDEKQLEEKITGYLKSFNYEDESELIPFHEMKCKFTEDYVDHLQKERVELSVQLDRIPNWIKKIFK